jgi:predicted RNase H-like HicB family nuclease
VAGTERIFTAAVVREDDWYIARCLEVEVASQGRTVEEALVNLSEALELYFEDEPTPPASEPVEVRQVPVHLPA